MKNNSQNHIIQLAGITVPFSLTFGKQRKFLTIRIGRDGAVRVSAPAGTPYQKITEFMKKKGAWLVKHIRKAENLREQVNPLESVLYKGELYPIELIISSGKRLTVALDQIRKKITVFVHTKADTETALKTWLRAEARALLSAETRKISETLGIPFGTLYLRNQRSRWGSSSGRGNISLNWRLVMAPEEVRRYLIIHELCHQKHYNHSQRFWKEVAVHCPAYKVCDRWLKKHAVLTELFR